MSTSYSGGIQTPQINSNNRYNQQQRNNNGGQNTYNNNKENNFNNAQNTNNNDATQGIPNENEPPTGDPLTSENITEGLIGKKRGRNIRVTLKETNILSAKGLWLLYDEMQKLPLQRTSGKEVSNWYINLY